MAVTINIPSQVKTYANLAAFPASGSLKTIYIAEDTNKTYRWTGSVYVEISASAAMTWGQIGGTLSNQTDLQTALNAKQDSLGFTAVPTTRTLTINGTTQDLSANRTFTIPTDLTVGTTPISSGTIGRVLFQGTGNVLQQSSSLFWDSTNERLGIGTATPNGRFHVKGSVASEIFKAESTIAALYAQFVSSDGACEFGIYTDALYFQPLPSLANGTRFLNGGNTIIMQLAQTGNVGINTTTDAGFRLDVNGTARVQDNTTITKTQDAITSLSLLNGSTGANASSRFYLGNTQTQLAKLSSGYTSGSILKSGDFFMYNQTVGNITFWNNLSTGNINFTTGSASSPQMTLKPSGVLNLSSVPTSPVGLSSGDLWNNLGVLMIV